MASQILNVSVVSAYLKHLLESDDTLSDCWIQGEVSERFEARSGHVYFTIVDGQSILKSVIFKGNAVRQRVPIRDGDQVVAHGRLTIYDQRSQYQLIADSVQPAGQGLQALQLELLRQKLEIEGLFDPTRKRPLPEMPCTIGVVTSADGAVWHDIQQVLRRRFPLATLVISPAQVQGDGAAASLVASLQRLIDYGQADVIIVGRGGGSAEDLAAFNDERVVRAVFASPVPTISAVGHETDWTLCDLVADVRAPTPSAAAELVAPSIDDLADYAHALALEVQRRGRTTIELNRANLSHLQRGLRRRTMVMLFDRYRPDIQRAAMRITTAGHTKVERSIARSGLVSANGRHHWQLAASHHRALLDRRETALIALNPHSVMERGFALVARTHDGMPIRSIDHVRRGDSATVSLVDGEFLATVDATPSSLFHREDPSS